MFGLDELTAVIPPPDKPRVTMSDVDWLRIFSQYGTRLPTDFVQVYKRYGNGFFNSISHPISASVSLYGFAPLVTFERYLPERLTALRVAKEKRPNRLPFPLYWEPNGLLPWGIASNKVDLCWRVRGELVDNWEVVVIQVAKGNHQSFSMSAIQFLARVIAGTVKCDLLPKGLPGEKGVEFSVWMDLVMN